MPAHERACLDIFVGRVARRAIRERQVARERLLEKAARQGYEDRAEWEAAPLGIRVACCIAEAFLSG